ncbi:helix-turn-helix domain-containing protein [Mycobacterium sp.]|uniref:TetR/AcrR family transcriptional regulator n=1 Tax=Mycobacterium sp. TaxID=1785 RepID=UPI0031D6D3A0
MAGNDWLAARRGEVAADRILDAAEELFTRTDPSSVGMSEIASAAGCSRATLYRYFENRDALRTAYVHREARRLAETVQSRITGVDNPGDRLVAGITTALRLVRENPPLAAWFTAAQPPIGAEMADKSEVIAALAAAFVTSLGAEDPAEVERRARWLVRVITSLLIFPGRDDADERAMVEEFVVPIAAPGATPARQAQVSRAPA